MNDFGPWPGDIVMVPESMLPEGTQGWSNDDWVNEADPTLLCVSQLLGMIGHYLLQT